MKAARKVTIFLLLFCVRAICFGQIEITLNRSFIQKYANRATITSDFRVEKTSAIHSASQDGDIHAAGAGSEIGMVAVAEVMNAKTERSHAVLQLTGSVSSGQPVHITGLDSHQWLHVQDRRRRLQGVRENQEQNNL